MGKLGFILFEMGSFPIYSIMLALEYIYIIIFLGTVIQALVDGFPAPGNGGYRNDCFHESANRSGKCQPLSTKCEYALLNWENNQIEPQTCRLAGNGCSETMICCPYGEVLSPEHTDLQSRSSDPNKARCATFAKYVFDSQNRSHCGSDGRPLIYGGTAANGKEFPHMALIGYGVPDRIGWNCGGSLISEQWVLTAGHCIDTTEGPAKFVRLGDLDWQRDDDDAEPQNFLVLDRKKHPGFTNEQYDDIGLLRLNRFVIFTDYVRPGCLWQDRELPRRVRAIASGWGVQGPESLQSANLLKVTLEIKEFGECNATFPVNSRLSNDIVYSKQVCAGPMKRADIKDPCPGDSGSPLQIYAEPINPEFYCMYFIVGVTSFGLPCGVVSRPSVYTRVSHYLPWIESVVWPN